MYQSNFLIEQLIQEKKSFIIDHNNFHGEFRYSVLPSKETLLWVKNNYNNKIKDLNDLPEFYSQSEAVRFCENNYFILK